jgi:hypothetical protein
VTHSLWRKPPMSQITRRDVIKAGVAASAAVATAGKVMVADAAHAAPVWSNEPEPGAQIRGEGPVRTLAAGLQWLHFAAAAGV